MASILIIGTLLVITTTFLHYEVLGLLNFRLTALRVPDRGKVAIVILVAFLAHAIEMAIYGSAYFLSASWLQVGALRSGTPVSFFDCLYFSAETYTSLGFGDITPSGPIRLLVGVEALNGLLLIAWTASFTYLSMERFWTRGAANGKGRGRQSGPLDKAPPAA